MAKVKTVVIGVGGMAGHHASLLNKNEKCEVTAICDIKKETAQKKAEECSCAYYTDYKEMLASADFTAVLIGTPNKLHYEIAFECLDAEKHTAVEYPICQTVTEFEALHKKADEKGVLLADFATPFREPQPLGMKEMLPSIGKIMSMRSVYFSGSRTSWYTNEKIRGNFYSALTLHQIIYYNIVMGEIPEWVHGSLNSAVIDSEKNENMACGTYLCRYSDGTLAFSDWGMGFDNSPSLWEWIIEGEAGRLIYEPHRITLKQKEKEDVVRELELSATTHSVFINNFIEAILEGKDLLVSKEDSRSIINICEQALVSAESGKVVNL